MNEESNTLLAEFVGYKLENKRFQSLEYHSSNESHWEWNEGEIVTLNGNEVCDYSQEPYFSLEDLPFDSDWNWLMEVVDKIESLCKNRGVEINSKFVHIRVDNNLTISSGVHSNRMEAVYSACVKYVQWYNENK